MPLFILPLCYAQGDGTDMDKLKAKLDEQQRQIDALKQKLDGQPARPADKPQADAATSSPLQFKIGDSTITPVGFMDLTASWKDKNAGGSFGTSFGSIPYNTAATAKLSEFRFSPQNSRIGFRVDEHL